MNHCFVSSFILVLLDFAWTADYITKVVCFGDELKLACGSGEKIEIVEAYYKEINKNSKICQHISKTNSTCQVPRSVSLVLNSCNGKSECVLGYEIRDDRSYTNSCQQQSVYFNILYTCVKTVLSTTIGSYIQNGLSITTVSNDQQDMRRNMPPSAVRTTAHVDTLTVASATSGSVTITPIKEKETTKKPGGSPYMSLVYLFLGFKERIRQIAENPRKVILCVILSLSGGVTILILYVFLFGCCSKLTNRKDKFDIEDGPLNNYEVSAPLVPNPESVTYETVLVTRQNGVALSETQLSSDSTLLAPKGKRNGQQHQVISTIRRSHSIDEGTQTDNEDTESVDLQPQKLSTTEVQELGYLVDVMKFYNSRLDDEVYPELKFSSTPIKNTQPSRNNNNTTFHYSQPNKPSYTKETRPLLQNQASTSTEPIRYSPIDGYSSSDERSKTLSKKTYSRNPSEISYETSASNVSHNSLDLYTSDAIFNGSILRQNSMQRKPKQGVRGHGFEFIDTRTTPKF